MDKLQELSRSIKACSACELRESCTAPVPGIGTLNAEYLICGEAPGKEEDLEGIPFIGASGKRLDKLLDLAGIDRDSIFISNTVRCRPPDNAKPKKRHVKRCIKFLFDEIALVKPKKIITLGSTPLSAVTDKGITKLHGTMFEADWNGQTIDTIAMYHPAAALHQPRLWAVMLTDWEVLPNRQPASFVVMPYQEGHVYQETVALDVENDSDGSLGQWSVARRDGEGQLVIDPYFGPMPQVKFPGRTIFHNAKYDLREMAKNDMPLPEPTLTPETLDLLVKSKPLDPVPESAKDEIKIVDTMISAYCLGMGRQEMDDTGQSGGKMVGGLGLKYLTRRHLGWEMEDWHPGIEDIETYNAKDSAATYLLWEKWEPQLPQHFWKIDMPLLPVLMAMEDRGIAVDSNFLSKYMAMLDVQLAEIDLPFNPHATQEIQSYIYGTLGIEPWKFTENGAPSTERQVLETIDDPTVKNLLRYGELYTERFRYAGEYPGLIGIDGRLHPEIKQTSTATSRISIAKPHLQNIPRAVNTVRNEKTGEVTKKTSELRALFIAGPGKALVVADASQLDLRAYVAITQDPEMLRIYREGEDIHAETAAALGVTRDDGKTINFTWLFDGSAWKASQQFHIPIDKAAEYMRLYHKKYPTIKAYQEHMRRVAHNEQKVVDLLGRERRLDAMYTNSRQVQREGERQAINYPVQMTEAEVVKIVMIDLHYRHHAPMLIQVHDELVFEVDERDARDYALWLKEYLPTIVELNGVRFPWSVGYGPNWLIAKKNEV